MTAVFWTLLINSVEAIQNSKRTLMVSSFRSKRRIPVERMSANVCLSQEQMSLAGSPFESWLYRYLFLPVFAVGLIGNVANLCVLLSPSMRNRSNNLLSALAFVDMAFLLAMLPHSLANYTDLALNHHFRSAYLFNKLQVNWVANWLSAAAVW